MLNRCGSALHVFPICASSSSHFFDLLVCIYFYASLQAITGINSVVFYSTTIFGLAGFDEAIIGTSLVGVVNVVTTIITSNLIDKYGRKVLLLTGTSIM